MPKHGSPGYQPIEQDDYSDGVYEEVCAWVERHGIDPHEEYQIAEDDFALLTISEMLDAVLEDAISQAMHDRDLQHESEPAA